MFTSWLGCCILIRFLDFLNIYITHFYFFFIILSSTPNTCFYYAYGTGEKSGHDCNGTNGTPYLD